MSGCSARVRKHRWETRTLQWESGLTRASDFEFGEKCKDAGIYARGLADNCLKGVMEGGEEDPLRLMEKAHKQTLAPGASTACIVQIEHSTSTARI
eukprot:74085-Prorocentrum_minimum.AAC.1